MNIFEELSEQSRRTLLIELLGGAKNVSELVEITNFKQPNVSNHLARLRARGLVETSKIGRQVFYKLANNEVRESLVSYMNANVGDPSDVDLHAMAKDFAKAAIRGSEATCQEYLDLALRAQHTLLDIYEILLGSAMAAVGLWYKVEAIDEGEEHMASEITMRMMARAVQHFGPRKKTDCKALLGCAPGNYHVIGLRMVGDYMQYRGWQVFYTGSDTPNDAFMKAIDMHGPDLVLLGCAAEEGVDTTVELLKQLVEKQSQNSSFKIGVGGSAVHRRSQDFHDAGAKICSSSLRSFAEQILPEFEQEKTNSASGKAS